MSSNTTSRPMGQMDSGKSSCRGSSEGGATHLRTVDTIRLYALRNLINGLENEYSNN